MHTPTSYRQKVDSTACLFGEFMSHCPAETTTALYTAFSGSKSSKLHSSGSVRFPLMPSALDVPFIDSIYFGAYHRFCLLLHSSPPQLEQTMYDEEAIPWESVSFADNKVNQTGVPQTLVHAGL